MGSHETIDVQHAETPDRRWPGFALGLGSASLLIGARLTTILLFGLLAVWTVLSRDRLKLAVPPLNPLTGSLAALIGYAMVSSLWAASIVEGIAEGAMAAVIALACLMLLQFIKLESRPNLVRLGQGMWIGFAVGLAYFFIEETTGQAIKIWIYNHLHFTEASLGADVHHRWAHGKLVSVSKSTLSRNVAPMTPLLWASIMAVLGGAALARLPRIQPKAIALAVYLFCCIVIFLSPHETSKVAVVAGTVLFAIAYFWREWAYLTIKAIWVIACLGVVPAAFLAYKLDLQNAPWLQRSAQHRIVIWNFTAEQIVKAPVLGAGIYTTYVKGPDISAKASSKPGDRFKAGMSRHAHNVFLQTWFELGLVGACLLLAAGLAIIGHIRKMPDQIQPFALAAMTSSTVLMSSSYGVWQDWFLSLFALTAVFFAIGARILSTRPEPHAA